MAGVFELFHLSLLERAQGELFDGGRPSREQWLRSSFSEQFTFTHRSRVYWWVPAKTDPNFIAGNIARSHPRRHHTPPEEGAMEVISDEWQGAMVIIDPTHHDDGQKLSFERDDIIGRPRSVLPSLLGHLNRQSMAPYMIVPKPIFRKSSFWDWAAAHEFKLRRITFEFIVPNMFGAKNGFDEDMEELGRAGVTRALTTLDHGNRGGGIDARSDAVRHGVDYAAQGGGEVSARALNGENYNSTTDAETATLPVASADRRGGLKALARWFPTLLGRHEPDAGLGVSGSDTDNPAGG